MLGRSRKALTRVVGWVGVVALAWAILLNIVGGFETRVLGVSIRAHDPYNPLILAVLCLCAYGWLRRPSSRARLSVDERRARILNAAPIAAILLAGAIARF